MFFSATLTVSLLTQPATAWEPRVVNGQIVTWNSETIGFQINTDDAPGLTETEVISAIQSAASEWNGDMHGANTAFKYDGTSKKRGADLSDEIHLVSFDTTWNQDPSLLAVTHVWSNSNNDIVHFDIEVNADDVYWSTTGDPNKHDLHNTMTHEFGHALGLEHSDEAEASMSSTTSVGELSKRDIHDDDIQGFVTLYPFTENGDDTDPNLPSEETNETSSGSGGGNNVDNALIPASGSGDGNMGPVSLEKAGCSSTSTNPGSTALLGFLSFLFVLSFRRPL
jgi:uncharacterized protein (TIGR03382 family)